MDRSLVDACLLLVVDAIEEAAGKIFDKHGLGCAGSGITAVPRSQIQL